MIKRTKWWTVNCGKCDKLLITEEGKRAIYFKKNEAVQALSESDWIEIDFTTVCPDCVQEVL